MTLEHPDHDQYREFTSRQRFDTAIQTLSGLLHGIAIDGKLNAVEVAEILNWCDGYRDLIFMSPFDEIIPTFDRILEDGIIDEEEQKDILWVCHNLSEQGDFYDEITHKIQQLHGILHGILADAHISKIEAESLQDWMEDNFWLKGTYPYDELESMLIEILRDGVIDDKEQSMLNLFFEKFIQYSLSKQVREKLDQTRKNLPKEFTLPEVCSYDPKITFDGRTFTFTGSSHKSTKAKMGSIVENLGGKVHDLTLKTDFLVVGSKGNPAWAFTCYGRKIETAVKWRKEGHPIIVVHENDFWDSTIEHGIE